MSQKVNQPVKQSNQNTKQTTVTSSSSLVLPTIPVIPLNVSTFARPSSNMSGPSSQSLAQSTSPILLPSFPIVSSANPNSLDYRNVYERSSGTSWQDETYNPPASLPLSQCCSAKTVYELSAHAIVCTKCASVIAPAGIEYDYTLVSNSGNVTLDSQVYLDKIRTKTNRELHPLLKGELHPRIDAEELRLFYTLMSNQDSLQVKWVDVLRLERSQKLYRPTSINYRNSYLPTLLGLNHNIQGSNIDALIEVLKLHAKANAKGLDVKRLQPMTLLQMIMLAQGEDISAIPKSEQNRSTLKRHRDLYNKYAQQLGLPQYVPVRGAKAISGSVLDLTKSVYYNKETKSLNFPPARQFINYFLTGDARDAIPVTRSPEQLAAIKEMQRQALGRERYFGYAIARGESQHKIDLLNRSTKIWTTSRPVQEKEEEEDCASSAPKSRMTYGDKQRKKLNKRRKKQGISRFQYKDFKGVNMTKEYLANQAASKCEEPVAPSSPVQRSVQIEEEEKAEQVAPVATKTAQIYPSVTKKYTSTKLNIKTLLDILLSENKETSYKAFKASYKQKYKVTRMPANFKRHYDSVLADHSIGSGEQQTISKDPVVRSTCQKAPKAKKQSVVYSTIKQIVCEHGSSSDVRALYKQARGVTRLPSSFKKQLNLVLTEMGLEVAQQEVAPASLPQKKQKKQKKQSVVYSTIKQIVCEHGSSSDVRALYKQARGVTRVPGSFKKQLNLVLQELNLNDQQSHDQQPTQQLEDLTESMPTQQPLVQEEEVDLNDQLFYSQDPDQQCEVLHRYTDEANTLMNFKIGDCVDFVFDRPVFRKVIRKKAKKILRKLPEQPELHSECDVMTIASDIMGISTSEEITRKTNAITFTIAYILQQRCLTECIDYNLCGVWPGESPVTLLEPTTDQEQEDDQEEEEEDDIKNAEPTTSTIAQEVNEIAQQVIQEITSYNSDQEDCSDDDQEEDMILCETAESNIQVACDQEDINNAEPTTSTIAQEVNEIAQQIKQEIADYDADQEEDIKSAEDLAPTVTIEKFITPPLIKVDCIKAYTAPCEQKEEQLSDLTQSTLSMMLSQEDQDTSSMGEGPPTCCRVCGSSEVEYSGNRRCFMCLDCGAPCGGLRGGTGKGKNFKRPVLDNPVQDVTVIEDENDDLQTLLTMLDNADQKEEAPIVDRASFSVLPQRNIIKEINNVMNRSVVLSRGANINTQMRRQMAEKVGSIARTVLALHPDDFSPDQTLLQMLKEAVTRARQENDQQGATQLSRLRESLQGEVVDVTITFVGKNKYKHVPATRQITKQIYVPGSLLSADGSTRKTIHNDQVTKAAQEMIMRELQVMYPNAERAATITATRRQDNIGLGSMRLRGVGSRFVHKKLELLSAKSARDGMCVLDYASDVMNRKTGTAGVSKKKYSPHIILTEMIECMALHDHVMARKDYELTQVQSMFKSKSSIQSFLVAKGHSKNEIQAVATRVIKTKDIIGECVQLNKYGLGDHRADRDDLLAYGIPLSYVVVWATLRGDIDLKVIDPLTSKMVLVGVDAATRRNHKLVFGVFDGHLYPIDQLPDQIVEQTSQTITSFDESATKDDQTLLAYVDKQFNGGFRLEMGGFTVTEDDEEVIGGAFSKPIIYKGDLDGYHLLSRVCNSSGFTVCDIKMSSAGSITAFVHPVNDLPVFINSDVDAVRSICLTENSNTDIFRESFVFKGQQLSSLSRGLLSKYVGDIPGLSTDVNDVGYIFKRYSPRAIVYGAGDNENGDIAIDITSCYPTCLQNNEVPYMIPDPSTMLINAKGTPVDQLSEGSYYIVSPFMFAGFYFHRMLLHPIIIRRISKIYKNISVEWELKCVKQLKPDLFKPLVDLIKVKYPTAAKQLLNSMIGSFNMSEGKRIQMLVCSDEEFAKALCNIHNLMIEKANSSHDAVSDSFTSLVDSESIPGCHGSGLFFVKSVQKQKLDVFQPYVYSVVMGNYIANTLDLINHVSKDLNICLSGLKTDCYYLKKSREGVSDKRFNESVINFMNSGIGGYSMREEKDSRMKVSFINYKQPLTNIQEWQDVTSLTEIGQGQSIYISGPGGSGKSTMILQDLFRKDSHLDIFNSDENMHVTVLCPTYKLLSDWSAKCDRLRGDRTDITINFKTFASVSFRYDLAKKKNDLDSFSSQYELVDVFLLDEVSMMDYKTLLGLSVLKEDLGVKFVLIGDFVQVPPVQTSCVGTLEHNSKFADLADFNRLNRKLIEGKCRFNDLTTIKALTKFREEGLLDIESLGDHSVVDSDVNITYTNATKNRIIKNKGKTFESLVPGDEVYLSVRREDIARFREYKLLNGTKYVIVSREDNAFTLRIVGDESNQVIKVPRDLTSKDIISALACTTHKLQGATVHNKYMIHDINLMDHKLLYTALSRCVDIKNVSVSLYGVRGDRTTIYKDPNAVTLQTIEPEYQKEGFIYEGPVSLQWMVNCATMGDKTGQDIHDRVHSYFTNADQEMTQSNITSIVRTFNFGCSACGYGIISNESGSIKRRTCGKCSDQAALFKHLSNISVLLNSNVPTSTQDADKMINNIHDLLTSKDLSQARLYRTVQGDIYRGSIRSRFNGSIETNNYFTSTPLIDVAKIIKDQQEEITYNNKKNCYEYIKPWRTSSTLNIKSSSKKDLEDKVEHYVHQMFTPATMITRSEVKAKLAQEGLTKSNFVTVQLTGDSSEKHFFSKINIDVESIPKDNHTSVNLVPGLLEIICTEHVNQERLTYLVANGEQEMHDAGFSPDQIESQLRVLKKIHSKVTSSGDFAVCYHKGKASAGVGRVYADGGISLGCLKKDVRGFLSRDYYDDVDMSNAHPYILSQLVDDPPSELTDYVNNRDARLAEVMAALQCDRNIAKKLFLIVMYGGDLRRNCQELGCDPSRLPPCLSGFAEGLKAIIKDMAQYHPSIRSDQNITCANDASVSSILLQEIENRMLYFMYDYLRTAVPDFNNDAVLCFDGIMIPKKYKLDEAMINSMQEYVLSKTGYSIKLEKKAFSDASFNYAPSMLLASNDQDDAKDDQQETVPRCRFCSSKFISPNDHNVLSCEDCGEIQPSLLGGSNDQQEEDVTTSLQIDIDQERPEDESATVASQVLPSPVIDQSNMLFDLSVLLASDDESVHSSDQEPCQRCNNPLSYDKELRVWSCDQCGEMIMPTCSAISLQEDLSSEESSSDQELPPCRYCDSNKDVYYSKDHRVLKCSTCGNVVGGLRGGSSEESSSSSYKDILTVNNRKEYAKKYLKKRPRSYTKVPVLSLILDAIIQTYLPSVPSQLQTWVSNIDYKNANKSIKIKINKILGKRSKKKSKRKRSPQRSVQKASKNKPMSIAPMYDQADTILDMSHTFKYYKQFNDLKVKALEYRCDILTDQVRELTKSLKRLTSRLNIEANVSTEIASDVVLLQQQVKQTSTAQKRMNRQHCYQTQAVVHLIEEKLIDKNELGLFPRCNKCSTSDHVRYNEVLQSMWCSRCRTKSDP
jgi:hypothetical protein